MEANYLSALLDKLVPSAREYGKEHLSILGVILGMIVMAVSLWLLGVTSNG